jgi:hypothetical protein
MNKVGSILKWERSDEDKAEDKKGVKKMMAKSGKCKCGKGLDDKGKCKGCGSSPGSCKCMKKGK